jgi:hypothetical protein
MSDSESDGFRIADDSGSDDFAAPVKAKKAAPAKKAAASSSKATKVCASTCVVRSELISLGSCRQESPSQETSGSQEECTQ